MILPGECIGILGSGQLGRMLAQAAQSLGYRVHVYSPDENSPASSVAHEITVADYNNEAALRLFAERSSVVTFEFENIPENTARIIEQRGTLYHSANVLSIFQNRIKEKGFLSSNNIPCAPYAVVRSLIELREAIKTIGTPAVLKTSEQGYDGKGQWKIASQKDLDSLDESIFSQPLVLEGFIDFVKEISLVAARSQTGEFSAWDILDNTHVNHILHLSSSPAQIADDIAMLALSSAKNIFEAVGAVGVMCIEFFVTKDNRVLVNEVAPRVHNSGHLTIEASVTSQFEQHIRAVTGLPLGSIQARPAAMINLLGDVWEKGEPNWELALKDSRVKLHLYGKTQARNGRKMGHMTAIADSTQEAINIVSKAYTSLRR